MYRDSQISAVRRLSDTRPDTASIVRVLTEIARYPMVVTSERWIAAARKRGADLDDWWRESIEKDFRPWAEEGAAHVDKIYVRADLGKFKGKVRKVRDFADKAVAHRHDGEFESTLTYAELDEAIDLAGLLWRRYTTVLDGSMWAMLEPAINGDWLAAFRRPLFDRSYRPPEAPILPDAPQWSRRDA